jgi:hypothetical protein
MIREILVIALLLPMVFSNLLYAHSETEQHQREDSSHANREFSGQTIKLSIVSIDNQDNKKYVKIKLTKIKDNSPVTPDLLREVHTQKIHLLIIDDSLTDYSHIHPKPTKDEGVYEFEWSPTKQDANYRIWADLLPINTKTQEYALANLTTAKEGKAQINRTVLMQTHVDGINFKLSFDSPTLQAEKPSMGKVIISEDNGSAVQNLEPIMGAFAHIVGFNEDFQTIVHIHPMGKEPTKVSDRGGPELQFHIEPEKSGFTKLFIQVSINGKELFAPFGLLVK